MDLSVQDWLIAIGALIIVGVLLDAYRRYRNERRNPIKMGKGSFGVGGGFARDEAEAPALSELPGGGARVIRERDEPPAPRTPTRGAARVEPSLDADPPLLPLESAIPAPVASARAEAPAAAAAAGAGQDATEVLLIHVMARAEQGFSGQQLLEIFRICDVRFGERRIFHRFEQEKGQGEVQFSVVNTVEPGTFDPAQMEQFATPGLSFFMRLPGPLKPVEAFDCMLETARSVARNLDGEMRDESHSVFMQQTAEHCRQRIRDYLQRAKTRR